MSDVVEPGRLRAARLDPHSTAFTILLGSLVTLASFATDMGLPVLAETARSLGVTPGAAALTLSVFLAGFAIGPLVFGPLSDHFGRRPVLLTGCGMFACFGALGAFSRSLHTLLLWRLLMGVGAGGCQVLVLAVVRDLFRGAEARVKQSYVNLAGGVAPIIAPTLGIAIATFGGWRAIYAALAIGATVLLIVAWLGLVERGRRGAPGQLTARAVVDNYVRVLRHPVAFGYVLVIALNFGSLFAYVSGSSLVLIGLLGVSRRTYGFLFAATSLGLMAGALVSARLSARGVSQGRLIRSGLAVIVSSSVALLALTLAGALRAPTLVGLVIVGFVGQGIVRPNAAQGALEPMSSIAGVASAVMSGTQMLTGALASALVAALFDGRSAIAVTGMMALSAVMSAMVYGWVVRPAERRLTRTATSTATPSR
jgi:DHA1 family bicyclomycin/chloramphenicol resistance-like MFS transporter